MSSRRMKIPEPLRAAYKLARSLHWEVERARNGHLRWVPPEGGPGVQTGSTPARSGHDIKNELARLRKAGLPC